MDGSGLCLLGSRQLPFHNTELVCVVLYAAGNIAVYSCEKNGFAKLRNIQALFVGWAVLETAFRQVTHQGSV